MALESADISTGDISKKLRQIKCSLLKFRMIKFIKTSEPGPHLMQIHLVRYSTSARYENYSNIHLVWNFALSTSWIN